MPGANLLGQLQPLRAHAIFKLGKPGGVTTWPRQTVNKTSPDGIRHKHEYDRHSTCRLKHSSGCSAAHGQHDIWSERSKIGSYSAASIHIARGPSRLDPEVLAVGPVQLGKCCYKHSEPRQGFAIPISLRQEPADAPHAFTLLRTRNERPRCRRTTQNT